MKKLTDENIQQQIIEGLEGQFCNLICDQSENLIKALSIAVKEGPVEITYKFKAQIINQSFSIGEPKLKFTVPKKFEYTGKSLDVDLDENPELGVGKDRICIKKCSSCGENHKDVIITELKQPKEDYTHEAICPVSDNPILVKHCAEEKDAAKV